MLILKKSAMSTGSCTRQRKRMCFFSLAPAKITLLGAIIISTACSNMQVQTSSDADWVSGHELYDGSDENLFVNSEFKGEEGKKGKKGEEDTEPTKADFIAAGDNAWSSGDTEKALFEYLRALKLDDRDKDIYFKIGVVHETRGNYRLAEIAYGKCIEIDPDYVPALTRKGTMQLKHRKYTAAKLSFDRAIELDRKRLRQLATLARQKVLVVDTLVKEDKFPDTAAAPISNSAAADIMETARAGILDTATAGKLNVTLPATDALVAPEYDRQSPFQAYNGLGVIEDLEGNHYQAVIAFEVASSIAPELPFIYNNMGYSSYLADDLDAAEVLFKKAVSKDPVYKAAWRNLALVYVRRGRYEEAISILASQVDSEASAYNTVGYLCMLDNEHQKAEAFLTKAIELSPVYYKVANENLKRNQELASKRVH